MECDRMLGDMCLGIRKWVLVSLRVSLMVRTDGQHRDGELACAQWVPWNHFPGGKTFVWLKV